MNLGETGLKLIKSFEGLRLEAYLDSVKVPTIGYGHTRGVALGLTCIEAQAGAWVLEDVQEAEAAVNRLVKAPLAQHQYDALVSFVFNVGAGNFASSTLLRKLNAEDYLGAAEQFLRWNRAGGKVLPGLTRRREAEKALFHRITP